MAGALSSVDPHTVSEAQKALRAFTSLDPGTLRVADDVFRGLRETQTRALTEAFGSIARTNRRNYRAVTNALQAISHHNEARLTEALRMLDLSTFNVGASHAAQIASTLEQLAIPEKYVSRIAAEVASLPAVKRSDLAELAPNIHAAVRDADTVAADGEVRTRAAELVQRLEELSPAERLAFGSALAAVIIQLALIYALLMRDARVEVAVAVVGVIPPLLAVAAILRGERHGAH